MTQGGCCSDVLVVLQQKRRAMTTRDVSAMLAEGGTSAPLQTFDPGCSARQYICLDSYLPFQRHTPHVEQHYWLQKASCGLPLSQNPNVWRFSGRYQQKAKPHRKFPISASNSSKQRVKQIWSEALPFVAGQEQSD